MKQEFTPELPQHTIDEFFNTQTMARNWEKASQFSGDFLAKLANAENPERLIQIIDQL